MKSLLSLLPVLAFTFSLPRSEAADPTGSAAEPATSRSVEPILCGVRPKGAALVSGADPSVVARIEELTPQERGALLYLLNSGSTEELTAIRGIAGTRAAIILRSRPLFELEELDELPGFGPGLVARILAHKDVAMR